MTRKTRGIFFVTSVILFVLLGTVLVFYSRGARFDLENWQIVQTGGIYLKTEPTDVEIQLDGEPVKNRAGILQSGTLINNLKPGSYKISIRAKDYHSWEKEVRVLSSTVAVLDGIILFPEKSELVASPTDKFLQEFRGEEIPAAELTRINTLFNQLKTQQLRLPGPVSLKKVLPYPYNDTKFIVMTDRALYALDTERRIVSQISVRAREFTLAGTDVYWFNDEGLFSFNLILRNQSRVTLPETLKTSDWSEIKVSPSSETVAILKKTNELVLFDRPANKVANLGNRVSLYEFSPDSRKIAFARDSSLLNVYVIRDGATKETFVLENSKNGWPRVEELTWHKDNNYLFLKGSNDILYFVEVSEFPPLNVVEVGADIKNFLFNKDDDYLYWEDPLGLHRVKL